MVCVGGRIKVFLGYKKSPASYESMQGFLLF